MSAQDAKDSLRLAWTMSTDAPWPFEGEFKFHPIRRWRFDWASPAIKLAVELEGVTHYGPSIGRHQTAKGLEADAEKYNAAIQLGWRVLRYTQRQVKADPQGVIDQILEVAALTTGAQ